MNSYLITLVAVVAVIGFMHYYNQRLLDSVESQQEAAKETLRTIKAIVSDLESEVRKALNANAMKELNEAKQLQRQIDLIESALMTLADKVDRMAADVNGLEVISPALVREISKLHDSIGQLKSGMAR